MKEDWETSYDVAFPHQDYTEDDLDELERLYREQSLREESDDCV